MQPEPKPILVTGAHRTGTTWVGKLLAADPGLAYVSEPLNVDHRPGVFGAKVRHWYTYICDENEGDYYPSFLELLAYRYHLGAEIGALRSGRDVLRMGRDLQTFAAGYLLRRVPLLKDPFAVLSVAWFAHRLNFQVVVTVRHPAAFVSSLKRLNWGFDFRDLLEQPLLMRDFLEPYRASMQSDAAGDIVGQASLLWVMIYQSVHVIRERLPTVLLVRHEDLSLRPKEGFETLYKQLGLDFSTRVQSHVLQSSSPENPVQLPLDRLYSVRLDSRASLENWKRRLTTEEINRIRQVTAPVARLYYPDEDWN
jgi:hypothetical protein